MYWADKIATQIVESGKYKPYWVDDMKTPSGRIHVGSLRGVLVHDFVHKSLLSKGEQSNYTYVYNDMDPMDGLPGYLDQSTYLPHMGKPLFKIPAPVGEKSISQYYADEFTEVFNRLGARPTVLWSSQLYLSGKMNSAIQIALDNAQMIRDVYMQVANYKVSRDWYPFQVFCEKCGKEGSTTTYKWDGEYVYYKCEEDKVEWAHGCGFTGKVSPFNGTGKLLWKVDWPAHWTYICVTIEGAGKDHTSAGGSRDMAREILKRVFAYPEPFDIPYEWLLIRGTKMSSSKGVGASAKEFADLLPPQVARFLFARTHCNTVIDFDLVGNTISDLFDEYDRCAMAYYNGKKDKYARIFEVSQIDKLAKNELFHGRFRDVAQYCQMPSVDIKAKFAEIKGSALSPDEIQILDERIYYAKKWISNYAPTELKFQLTEEGVKDKVILNEKQKEFVQNVISLLQRSWEKAEDFQFEIFESIKRIDIAPKQAFPIIYRILIGKDHGPKIAWFLLEQDKTMVIERLQKILTQPDTSTGTEVHMFPTLTDGKVVSISSVMSDRYTSTHIGVAIIRNVLILPKSEDLEIEKESVYKELKGVSLEQLNSFSEVQSYRKMYKEMGVDWHSRRPSPEALLRRFIQGKELYNVNTCVDAYNLIVMKYRVSVGAFDLDALRLPTVLSVANGEEKILLLGNTEETQLAKGEVFYQDQRGPFNLDFNYRDAQRTAVSEKTTNILINVDGVHGITRAQVERTLKETIEIIQKYCGGEVEVAGIVSASM
ncbi:lysine--tRNA ligase [Candidatus Woesebacteria bacterium]|nr:lysine--tRNA ligase [Candidatus Woesebacteria bacterium]